MLSNLRQHQKVIAEVLDDLWQKSEDWQWWSDFHQKQMQYFLLERQSVAIAAVGAVLATVMALISAIITNNAWLWLLVGLLAAILLAVTYYLSLYNQVLHQLEAQTLLLFENSLKMKNKPWQTTLVKVIDIAGQMLRKQLSKYWDNHD